MSGFTKIELNCDDAVNECDIRTIKINLEDTHEIPVMDVLRLEHEVLCCCGDNKINKKHSDESGVIFINKEELDELIWALTQMQTKMDGTP